MKRLLLLFTTAAVITACSAPADKTSKTDTVVAGDTLAKSSDTKTTNNTPTVSSLCYLHTQGKDSTSVELVIKGNKVSGVMNWLPYEKDSRKGKLDGTVKDSVINAVWTFMQEGMTDTMNVAFRVSNNTLAQKPLKLNTKTGRQQTDNSADYSVIYKTAEKLHK
ncbi:hypothetical protein [Mucilaginibacter ginkgonis]|uniref:Lipoprotein n=1 Tax=Mucilaginibacter ginkgonis TaxID=2682091 RepID=A0A6I4I2C0_9SPHI|nr:hypothetical protein [Mucilaginibacter ginkgonis]QQL48549.1 hypothetical protein GO620_010130 [Mucilaginibacter ginkgonis]